MHSEGRQLQKAHAAPGWRRAAASYVNNVDGVWSLQHFAMIRHFLSLEISKKFSMY
jgi:hypothetical protein